jgi:lysophospholipase L1-like esterase
MKKLLIYILKPSPFSAVFIFFSLYFLCFIFELSFFVSLFISFLVSEIICRIQFFLFHKERREKKYFLTKKDIPFTNHPYLPWVMRKNWKPPNNKKICSNNDFMLSSVAYDELGIGYNPDENITTFSTVSTKRFRVLVLGDSVSLNYASSSRKINYPKIIEKKLQDILGKDKIEVINGSFFAYTTQELLIKFLFDLQYLNPDCILFYGGYADIRGYLTTGFQTDFSHFRKSINPNYPNIIMIASLLSLLNSYFLDCISSVLFSTGDLKLDFIKMINKQELINLDTSPTKGLETFSRNIETLINVCKGKNIPLVISTYCHYLDDNRKKSNGHKIFNTIIQKQNCTIKKLCLSNNILCVDNANLIKLSDENFLDDVHFTENGMNSVAENFTNKIINSKIMEHLNDV